MSNKRKDLVQIIKDNPGCVAIIDNDCWSIHKNHPHANPHDEDDSYEKWEKWDKENELASDGEVEELGDGGYGSGNCYGGDILQALAIIVGVKVESV
jgi:hypothetical protein